MAAVDDYEAIWSISHGQCGPTVIFRDCEAMNMFSGQPWNILGRPDRNPQVVGEVERIEGIEG
jgi:hypothetical protein